jgi:hypothetical protein
VITREERNKVCFALNLTENVQDQQTLDYHRPPEVEATINVNDTLEVSRQPLNRVGGRLVARTLMRRSRGQTDGY